MANNRASTANGTHTAPEKSYYEQQRELLITEIAQVRVRQELSCLHHGTSALDRTSR